MAVSPVFSLQRLFGVRLPFSPHGRTPLSYLPLLLTLLVIGTPLPASAQNGVRSPSRVNLFPSQSSCAPGCICEASNTCWCPNDFGASSFGGYCAQSSLPQTPFGFGGGGWDGGEGPAVDPRSVCDVLTLNSLSATPLTSPSLDTDSLGFGALGPCDKRCTQQLVQSGIVSQGAVDERCIELDLDLPPATELAHIALDSSEYCIWDAPDIKKKMPDLPVLQMGAVQFVVGSLGLGSRPALGLDLLPFQLAGLFYDPVSIVYRKDLGLIREGELRYLGNNHAGVAISEPLQVPAGLYFIDLNIRTTILQPIRHLNTSRLFFAIDDAKARINSYLVLPQFRVLDSSNQYLSIPCPTYPPPVNFLPTTNPTTSNLQAAKKKVVTKKAPKKRVKAKKIRGKTKKQ